jgi:proline iminopeptidase
LDANGNFELDLAAGVEQFENKVLFMTGACQTLIGEDYQRWQMQLFPSAGLAVIPDAGHEMFLENPEASVEVVRAYLNTPLGE